MQSLLFRIGTALITFALGLALGVAWFRQNKSLRRTQTEHPLTLREETEWPLSPNVVSQFLQTREIHTESLKRNSPDDILWQWLSQSIARYQSDAGYAKRSLVLPLTGEHKYEVRLSTMTDRDLEMWNQYLQREGLPLLDPQRRYADLAVHLNDVICPNWGGVVDLEKPRLVHFKGSGG